MLKVNILVVVLDVVLDVVLVVVDTVVLKTKIKKSLHVKKASNFAQRNNVKRIFHIILLELFHVKKAKYYEYFTLL